MNFLLDTNVVSEWTKPRPAPGVIAWLSDVDEDRVFISVLTIAELQRGIELLSNGMKRTRLQSWLAVDIVDRFRGRVLDITPTVAAEWGRVSAASQRRGHPLSVLDAFFTATARTFDLVLVTRNVTDFAPTGVELFNPWPTA